MTIGEVVVVKVFGVAGVHARFAGARAETDRDYSVSWPRTFRSFPEWTGKELTSPTGGGNS